ncbi:MAG: dTMP kinase [Microthrixaceae bacterium]|jgi:dTMP kinase|nr:dTMP kinase [Microthrixaceae bacterium]HMS13491.1 dTMP kinase [Microthrixaceae bacterium]HMT22752.1 dTMP kinase [Microthrixaceae bacterium]HMT61047.1 dTMP kinase [Microthrixaceae bacterium]
MSRGRFIVFEGGEGVGKSTQAARLADRLGAVLTRQPGGTAIGAGLRRLLLDPSTQALSVRAEALLMAADRAQHRVELIEPSLAAGRHVVCDRYTYSSVAYQGYGRGLDCDEVREMSAWATEEQWPDLVILLDLDPEIAAQRLSGTPDRFESADAAFHRRVREGFLAMAVQEPSRWLVLDAARSADDLADEIASHVDAALEGLQR